MTLIYKATYDECRSSVNDDIGVCGEGREKYSYKCINNNDDDNNDSSSRSYSSDHGITKHWYGYDE